MKHAHFVGIGGSGLSAIATVLADSGWKVSGCDVQPAGAARELTAHGIQVFQGHAAGHINGVDVLIISSAIPTDSPEIAAAVAQGIPVRKRAEFLNEFLADETVVAVAGTHGKTTTTGLIAFLLDKGGLDPSFVVGGVLADYGVNARHSNGPLFVIEADEYDNMFLGLQPIVAVVTNIEHDHPDLFPSPESVQEAFQEFVKRIRPDGDLLACADDPGARLLADYAKDQGIRTTLYGLKNGPEWKADSIQPNGAGGSDFLVVRGQETLGLARSRLPGLHNVANSLAALAVATHFEVDFNTARNALAEYRGAERRFEIKGESGGVTVVDDYAHHPTEIRATLAAARRRYPGRGIWAMFQPHTYSRTRVLLNEFSASFGDADHVIVTDIFRSREKADPTISARDIVKQMSHPDVHYIAALAEATEYLVANLQPGDVLLTLGAGDGNTVGASVLKRLNGA